MLTKLIKILSILFILNLNILSIGFVSGTLVKTPNGYIPIEQLDSGHTVLTYDFKSKSIVSNEIAKIHKNRAKIIIQISLNNNNIYVSESNRFYCSLDNKSSWISAKKLSENNLLFKFSKEFVKIDKLFKFESSETYVYDLSIKNNHNFFVSENDILVHNEPLSISLGIFLGYDKQ